MGVCTLEMVTEPTLTVHASGVKCLFEVIHLPQYEFISYLVISERVITLF